MKNKIYGEAKESDSQREKLWAEAFIKATSNPTRYADDALAEFDKRFPKNVSSHKDG